MICIEYSILIYVSPLFIAGFHTQYTMNGRKEHKEVSKDQENTIVSESLSLIMSWKPVSDVYVYCNC